MTLNVLKGRKTEIKPKTKYSCSIVLLYRSSGMGELPNIEVYDRNGDDKVSL